MNEYVVLRRVGGVKLLGCLDVGAKKMGLPATLSPKSG